MSQRPNSPELDSLLHKKFPVLDHGFVTLRDYMGNDKSIEEAARISYGGGTRKVSETRGLLRYLLRNKHTSPFEMCEIQLHVKMPIFVARQWVRHRTANINEYSGRYSVMDKDFYMPSCENIQKQSKDNKQGRGGALTEEQAKRVQGLLSIDAERSYKQYEALLDLDLARELARMNLSVNFYTQWIWKIDLHNLLHFLNLRLDPHAQYEIRVYAETIYNELVKPWVPLTAEAFEDYTLGAETFSKQEMGYLRHVVSGQFPEGSDTSFLEKDLEEHDGLSKREVGEFLKKFQLGE